MNRILPPRPSLSHLKNQAKSLLKACKQNDPEAVQRVFQHVSKTRLSDEAIKLTDAQFVLAREYGFTGWPALKAKVDELSGNPPPKCRAFEKNLSYYVERANGLLSMWQSGQDDAARLFRQFHPRHRHKTLQEIKQQALTLDDAKQVFAAEHGYERWSDFSAYVQALASGEIKEPFLEAFEAIKAGDMRKLKSLVQSYPDILHAQGTNGNTLLHLASGCKQFEIVSFLLNQGSDPDSANNKGWTLMHQAAYSNNHETADLLLERGASLELSSHGDGGTPLVQALFWGHSQMADKLAKHGVYPCNLRVAAGIGDVVLIQSFFDAQGKLLPQAGAHREFIRPHSGFPLWHPSDDPREIIDEAFIYAAKNNRVEAMACLLSHGANVERDVYRGTALVWATFAGKSQAVEWLLARGANVNFPSSFGGPSHGEGVIALHLASQNNHVDLIRLLLSHGANPYCKDNLHQGTPLEWAMFNQAKDAVKYLVKHMDVTIEMASSAGETVTFKS